MEFLFTSFLLFSFLSALSSFCLRAIYFVHRFNSCLIFKMINRTDLWLSIIVYVCLCTRVRACLCVCVCLWGHALTCICMTMRAFDRNISEKHEGSEGRCINCLKWFACVFVCAFKNCRFSKLVAQEYFGVYQHLDISFHAFLRYRDSTQFSLLKHQCSSSIFMLFSILQTVVIKH